MLSQAAAKGEEYARHLATIATELAVLDEQEQALKNALDAVENTADEASCPIKNDHPQAGLLAGEANE